MGTPASSPSPSPLCSAEPPIITAELPLEHHALGYVRRWIQQESTFANMPPEMLFLILSHLDMADKARLLATCRYLRRLIEPPLYRFLSPDDTWKSRRRIKLLETLRERQDLLPSIRSFRGFFIPTSMYGPDHTPEEVKKHNFRLDGQFEDEWLATAVPLFTQAVNIRNLDLTGVLNWGKTGRWQILSGIVSNLKLNSFALNSSAGGQLDFIPLLRGQPELTRLELDCPTAEFQGLTTEDVPHLAYFKGTLSQAAEIVPGRPIRKLEVECVSKDECECLEDSPYAALALSSQAIKEFKMMVHCEPDNDEVKRMLQLITQHLPNIVHFTASLPDGVPAEVFLDEIPKLTSLSHLMLLKFDPDEMPWMSLDASVDSEDRWSRLCEKLVELCPSLTDIDYTPRVRLRCGVAAFSYYSRRREYL